MTKPRRFQGLPTRRVHDRLALVAEGRRARLLGLSHLDRCEAAPLLIPRCASVHTFGMRFALDLLFLDENDAVVERRRAVPPRRLAFCGGASAILEIPSGEGGEIAALES